MLVECATVQLNSFSPDRGTALNRIYREWIAVDFARRLREDDEKPSAAKSNYTE
jgi:hypothetical protein